MPSSARRGRRGNRPNHGDSTNGSLDATIFSTLPRDFLDYIFSLLPIKDSIRAGVVSKRFRNAWRFNRKLDFGQEFSAGFTRRELIDIINCVVTQHLGSEVQCFRLSKFDPFEIEEVVKQWIETVISKGVQELELDFHPRSSLKFPHDYFDIESVKVLKLSNCEINVQPRFKGLQFLKTLVLDRVDVDERAIEAMIGHCHLLDTFELRLCKSFQQLRVLAPNHARLRVIKLSSSRHDIPRIEIDAPALQTFMYYGHLPDFSLRNVMGLKDAFLTFTPPKGYLMHSLVKKNILQAVTHVQILTINSVFLEGLSPNVEDGRLQIPQYSFGNLIELQIYLDGVTYCNTHDISSFIVKCPKLERVFVDFNQCSFESGVYWELHQKHEVEQCQTLDNIKFIKIKNFRFQKHQFDLLKFFLIKATNAEGLALFTPRWHKRTTPKEFGLPATRLCLDDFYKTLRLTPRGKRVSCNSAEDESSMRPLHLKWH